MMSTSTRSVIETAKDLFLVNTVQLKLMISGISGVAFASIF